MHEVSEELVGPQMHFVKLNRVRFKKKTTLTFKDGDLSFYGELNFTLTFLLL
jgi:hypothetical protein